MRVSVTVLSLVNLIANKEVIKEMIQDKAHPEGVNNELNSLLNDHSYRSSMLNDYDLIYKMLDTGSASDNTARLMLEALALKT